MTAHPADSHDYISVVGAREHNLKDLTLQIPKRRITVFTGVSGSGKSSLVFSTIAAESQRLINETYSAFVQGFMPSLPRPDVDLLDGLTTAIVVDQQRIGGDPRSTVGTVTDTGTMLRVLFSRLGHPHIGGPQAFSFNVASVSGAGAVTTNTGGRTVKQRREFSITGGMCPRCEGRGSVSEFDLAVLYDETKSLNQGALLIPGYSMDGWYGRIYRGCGFFDPDTPIAGFTAEELDALLYKEATKISVDGVNITYEGIIPKIRKSMLSKDRDAMRPHIRSFVDRAITFSACPECGGTRLSEAARSVTIEGVSIADASRMQISDLADWVRGITTTGLQPLLERLTQTLTAFCEIGLGYLSLERPAGTLSGGEAQRTKMVRHLGSALTDVTYVFDEPSIGLHPHDLTRLNELMRALRDKGNTVLVVEHKPELIASADHVIDLGPGAGASGGTVCFEGDARGLSESTTVTGNHLRRRTQLKARVRTPTGVIEVRGADRHNLQDIDVDIPLGVLTVLTGVAGSGKSSLVHGSVAGREGVIVVDQAPIKGSRRSNAATYTGLFDAVRAAFAKVNGVKPGLFSANSDGACPQCNGSGIITTDLGIMASVDSVCELCEGRRYKDEVLDYTFGGKNISQVLELSIEGAQEFFSAPATEVPRAGAVLGRLVEIGFGYLTLGQPLSTLSGGERQRLKLAIHMAQPGGTYVLDEPTTGLHLADIAQLLALLDRLVDAGRSVIVVEHHQAVMAHADWIIDLGPGAGHDGGRVVFEGTPQTLVESGTTLTGRHLAQYLKRSN